MIEENFVTLPRGIFLMGSEYKENEQPVHEVEIDYDIAMSKYLVTVEDYMLFAQATGTEMPEEKHLHLGVNVPIRRLTWLSAVAYCKWLSEREGKRFRLPTEAEWEYACRAGSNSKYCFGDDISELGDYAWYKENSEKVTHDVASKKANAWGLYDMHGNIWEWCVDRYAENYEKASNDGSPYMVRSEKGIVLRGGSWSAQPDNLRSSTRINLGASSRNYFVGFRIVVEL
ncbi:MAG: Serine/threonine kinase [uncultured Sulfurovum sp.]|uniref:Serine/threonine kinase n=1 Tax=uncultured Sulfurovum sp. TaxID=269237 RepID=A0A6S6UGI8_9BACT|nr:MAG: Serine/threonine kinase [uncultured Sulfurovum sp.]